MTNTSSEFEWSSRRAPLWDSLNELLGESARRHHDMSAERVDLLVLRYQQTAADLAYLRTQHPGSTLIPRLNDVVARGHAEVYRHRGTPAWRTALDFVWNRYPRLVWEIRRYVYVAAAIEILFTVAGMVWALADPVEAGSFLPATMRDAAFFHHSPISAGLMSVTASSIFTNNILVSFTYLAGGLTAGIATLYTLYYNSMLLGVLSGLANERSFNTEFWSLILPHAVIELTAFTICGGAGLSIADAIVRARPIPRRTAIRIAGTRAVLIGVGTMPLLVTAGMIEGFVTPSALPIWAKLAVAPLTAIPLAAYLRRGRPARQARAGSARVSHGDALSPTPRTV